MTRASESLPLLITGLMVAAFVLLTLYPTLEGPDAAEGRVLSFIRVRDLSPEERCVDRFPVQGGFERINLNHDFGTAIRPRAALTAPDGTVHPATPTVQGLLLELERPEAGDWTLEVWVERTPGIASHIDRGEVFILGFPKGTGDGRQASLCQGSFGGP